LDDFWWKYAIDETTRSNLFYVDKIPHFHHTSIISQINRYVNSFSALFRLPYSRLYSRFTFFIRTNAQGKQRRFVPREGTTSNVVLQSRHLRISTFFGLDRLVLLSFFALSPLCSRHKPLLPTALLFVPERV